MRINQMGREQSHLRCIDQAAHLLTTLRAIG
jgi:hypothetical protein